MGGGCADTREFERLAVLVHGVVNYGGTGKLGIHQLTLNGGYV
jgi:hypothetical protein